MRTVVQRVGRAAVSVEGEAVGEIGVGLLALVAFAPGDGERQLRWTAEKLMGLRVFPDSEGRMNLDVREVGGDLLIVSQFTLYGDVSRGQRPSFVSAAGQQEARTLYDRFVDICRSGTVPVACGEFGARMEVELVNEGPVTLIIER